MPVGEVRIGTSGWSYPSGPGTWNGIFYPSRRSQPAGRLAKADELAYYAEHFDTVEVNSSFYRLPDPAVTRRWAAQTPSRFDFCLKLFQKFTHPAMYLKGADARAGSKESPIPAVTGGDVDAFRHAVDPLYLGRQTRRAPRAVPAELPAWRRGPRLPVLADAGVRGLPGRRRTPAPQLER